MPDLMLLEVRLNSALAARRLDELFPDGVFCLERLIPTPTELPDMWADTTTPRIFAQVLYNEGATYRVNADICGFSIPGTVTPGNIQEYLASAYPELAALYARLGRFVDNYGAYDKRGWRLLHWGVPAEPETLKTRNSFTVGGRVTRYALRCPSGGFHIAAALRELWERLLGATCVHLHTVLPSGELTDARLLSAHAYRIQPGYPSRSLTDVGFSLQDFGLRATRRGYRHIRLS